MPPGLKLAMKRKYPFFYDHDVHRTRIRPKKWKTMFTKMNYAQPKYIKLTKKVNISHASQQRKRKLPSLVCECNDNQQKTSSEPTCCACLKQTKILKKLRPKVLNWRDSSDDDEIFVNKKFRQKYGRVIVNKYPLSSI